MPLQQPPPPNLDVTVPVTNKLSYMGYTVNKNLLAIPIACSFLIAVLVPALVVGVLKHSVSSGAEVAGFAGISLGLLWAYVFWLLG
jgi:hypothetical protein